MGTFSVLPFFMEAGRVRELTKNASLIFMCGLWTEGIVYAGKISQSKFQRSLEQVNHFQT